MKGTPRDVDAARYAGLIYANREGILSSWLELVALDDDDPALEFIRSQLDATILGLASWLLDEDLENSIMSHQWSGIQPPQEMIVGAVLSLSLLPTSVLETIDDLQPDDRKQLAFTISEFTGELVTRMLKVIDVTYDDERWDQISREVEARYETQRAQRVRRLGVLIDIAHAVSTSLSVDDLFEHVRQSVTRLSGSDYIEISLLDPASGLLRCHLVYGEGRRRDDLEDTLIHEGLAAEVLSLRREFAVSDYCTACRQRGITPSSALAPAPQRAWMGAPMRQGDQIVGVIAVSGPLMSFDQEDVELLAAIARQTAVALENQRLIEAQQRHVAQLSAVNALARETADVRDAGTLIDIAVQRIHEFFGYGLVTAFRYLPDREKLSMQSRAPIPVDEEHEARLLNIGDDSVVGTVALTREAVMYPDVRQVPSYLITESTRGMRSQMTVPIVYSGELIGVLDVQCKHTSAFDKHDLTTLNTIADQIAVGLENSRLFANEAQRTHELELMLETTRAAGSSLLLDEVLEGLATGIARTADASICLIHLYDPDEEYFRPAVLVNPENEPLPDLFTEWNRMIAVDERSELRQILNDPFPQLMCPFPPSDEKCGSGPPVFLIPLRIRQRTLGLAIVAPNTVIETEGCPLINKMRLLQGVADSAALAVENARLYARAHGLAIAEERGRLAQEIHDTLAQGLTAISLQLDLADSYLPAKPEFAARNVRRALDLTRQNLDEARRSVLDLRAADVHQMSLPDAISRLLRRLGEESEITFDFSNEGLISRLSARVEVGLYRILEEALENARRHSSATFVRVTVQADGTTVAVNVEDNGEGFDPGAFARGDESRESYGLLGIRERARLLGGTLTILSTPGVGTSLRVVVPYEARAHKRFENTRDQGARA